MRLLPLEIAAAARNPGLLPAEVAPSSCAIASGPGAPAGRGPTGFGQPRPARAALVPPPVATAMACGAVPEHDGAPLRRRFSVPGRIQTAIHTPYPSPLPSPFNGEIRMRTARIDPETACAAQRGVIPPGRGRRGASSVPGGRLASGPPSLPVIIVSWILRECPADRRRYTT